MEHVTLDHLRLPTLQLPDPDKAGGVHMLSMPGAQAPEMKALQNLGIISINDEYGTPYDLLDKAKEDYRIWPHLDVCTNAANHKCPIYFSIHDDALTRQWDIDFFMNPPYSRVREFMTYAYQQHKKHNVNALILVYAKTDTKWWHDLVEGKAEIHFVRGRIKFNDMNGNVTKNSAPYPSVWIIWRKK